jgi:DNA (cytosine-5)-methyltransferase 1
MKDVERTTMSIGSLFDGSGTAPLAATILGWTPLWASEIEPYPVAVTKARFPNMIHLGDIAQINGAEVAPVDVIVGGSPCQDLSVAGKQAGLQDGSRSHLFYQMTRIAREMRAATNGKYPRFVVWENVPGAFSSNKGSDFHAVVAEFCAIADSTVSIPEPERNKSGRLTWENAGAVVGDGWSFAWRVLDAQYWGVPQRRRRIFAVLDLGSERAGEILFERAGLPRDSEPRGAEGQGAPADALGCADRGDGGGRCYAIDALSSNSMKSSNPNSGFHEENYVKCLDTSDCNPCKNQGGNVIVQSMPDVVYPAGAVGSLCARADSSPCIDRGQPFVATFSGGQGDKAGGIGYSEDASPTLKSTSSGGNTVPTVVYEPKSAMDENWAESDAKNALRANASKSAHVVVQDAVYALQGNGIDRALTAGCNGAGWREGEMYTLNTIDRPAVVFAQNQRDEVRDLGNVAGALNAAPGMKQQTYVAYAADCRNGALSEEISGTLQAKPNGGQSLSCVNPVVYDARGNGDGEVAATLTGDHQNRVTDYTNVTCYQNTGHGWWNEDDAAQTLRTPGGGDSTKANLVVEKRRRYIVRRLTPTECARLQGFPDWWTDGVQGSDSAKYKMWGNGMALPCLLAVLCGIDSHVRFFCAAVPTTGKMERER